ncbi:MAG: pyridoxamine 5'-phosphate oxidase family protein [Acidiferrobacterales bacterium]|nr:pyridoxamine 5'-phosphate oxidase family protein [Acidiferrobacterales bacterium]
MSGQVEQILSEIDTLIERHRSVELATVSTDGVPSVSYAPYVYMGNLSFGVFLSSLAEHTHNIAGNNSVSAMVITSEKDSPNLFARERVAITCEARLHDRKSDEFASWLPSYRERFGAIVDTLVQLADFNLYILRPLRAVYVKGFGQAYRISGDVMNDVEHITNPARDAQNRIKTRDEE